MKVSSKDSSIFFRLNEMPGKSKAELVALTALAIFALTALIASLYYFSLPLELKITFISASSSLLVVSVAFVFSRVFFKASGEKKPSPTIIGEDGLSITIFEPQNSNTGRLFPEVGLLKIVFSYFDYTYFLINAAKVCKFWRKCIFEDSNFKKKIETFFRDIKGDQSVRSFYILGAFPNSSARLLSSISPELRRFFVHQYVSKINYFDFQASDIFEQLTQIIKTNFCSGEIIKRGNNFFKHKLKLIGHFFIFKVEHCSLNNENKGLIAFQRRFGDVWEGVHIRLEANNQRSIQRYLLSKSLEKIILEILKPQDVPASQLIQYCEGPPMNLEKEETISLDISSEQ